MGPGDRRERPPAPDRTSHFDGFDAPERVVIRATPIVHRRGRNDRGEHATDEPGLEFGAGSFSPPDSPLSLPTFVRAAATPRRRLLRCYLCLRFP